MSAQYVLTTLIICSTQIINVVSPIRANDVNNLRGATIAIETELGINPSGVFGTVKDRLDALSLLSGVDGYIAASDVSLLDADGYFISTDVEGALAEIGSGAVGVSITGTGVASKVALWSSTTGLTSDTELHYDSVNNRLAIGTASPSSEGILTTAGNIVPSTNDTFSLGTDSLRWRDGYFGPGSIRIGTGIGDEGVISYDTSTNDFQISGVAGVTISNGISAPSTGASSESYGSGASTGDSNCLAVGASSSAAGALNVAIGVAASTSGVDATTVGAGSVAAANSISMGRLANSGSGSVALGEQANAIASFSIAIGRATSAGSRSIAIGDTVAAITGEFVAGATGFPISNVYFGEGKTDATPAAYTIHGTGGSGTDIAGANITIVA